jgi:uncharacterized protein (TIGR02453 family)
MTFFTKESLQFLEEIRNNNNKEWFEAHRHEYEAYILEPSRRFVIEMGEHLQALVPQINAHPKINGSLFRIFRDIRLSKDKTPLKSRIGIVFWRGSGKRLQSASFYLHFSPDELLVASGIRGFSKDSLHGYREYIAIEKNAKALEEIKSALQAKGYHFPLPHYKRFPRGFDKEMPYAHLSLYAAMFAYKKLPCEMIYHDNIIEKLYVMYEEMLPLFEWIYEMSLTVEITDAKGKSLHL